MRVLRIPALVLACLWVISCSAQAFDIAGRIVGVVDGDTVDIVTASTGSHRVRLSSIDAPERSQAFGQRSKEHLSGLVFGREVIARCSKMEQRPTGQRNRALCKIYLEGLDINLVQVQDGFAWHYTAYAREQPLGERLAYAKAETSAREAKRGLWSDPLPIQPWDWRHKASSARALP